MRHAGPVIGLPFSWVSGVASAAFVVCANAWTNAPAGFAQRDGQFVDIDPSRR